MKELDELIENRKKKIDGMKVIKAMHPEHKMTQEVSETIIKDNEYVISRLKLIKQSFLNQNK